MALVKHKVNADILMSKQKLTERLIKVWFRDPDVKALTSQCINSIPWHIEALLKSKGVRIKY